MGDTQLTRIGTDVKGRVAYLHPTAARAWAAATAYILATLGIDLSARIIQAYGQAAASAGTHGSPPCAVDIRVWGLTRSQIEALVRLLRECGWEATWYRDWAGNLHIHAACDIGTWSPARYQCTAVRAGYDGLGSGGRGGKDPHPKPSAWRTATQGTTWAEAQTAALTQKDDIMAMTPQERAALVAEIAEATRARIYEQRMTGGGIDPSARPTLHDYLVTTLPKRVTGDLLGQDLGRSGPAVGTAIQSTYQASRRLEAHIEALIALLEQAGPTADIATLQRIADQAAAKALAGLGDKLTQE